MSVSGSRWIMQPNPKIQRAVLKYLKAGQSSTVSEVVEEIRSNEPSLNVSSDYDIRLNVLSMLSTGKLKSKTGFKISKP